MTAKFINLTEDFLVSPQINTADVAEAAAMGVTLIVNNRPDGEMIGQPASAEIEAAAKAAGLSYVHIPVDGRGISPSHISALKEALSMAPEGKTLAFCRSGTRSTIVRAYLEAASGRDADAIIAEAAAAGYDISAHRPALEALKSGAK
ncbi:MAG: TIGR01244 family sulfur transferase [Parvularculaceae bacterium]